MRSYLGKERSESFTRFSRHLSASFNKQPQGLVAAHRDASDLTVLIILFCLHTPRRTVVGKRSQDTKSGKNWEHRSAILWLCSLSWPSEKERRCSQEPFTSKVSPQIDCISTSPLVTVYSVSPQLTTSLISALPAPTTVLTWTIQLLETHFSASGEWHTPLRWNTGFIEMLFSISSLQLDFTLLACGGPEHVRSP